MVVQAQPFTGQLAHGGQADQGVAELGTQVFFSRRDLFLFLKAVNYPELQEEVLSCDLPGSPAVCNWRPGLVLVNLNPEEASDKNPLTQAVGGSEIDCFGATVPACRTSEGATRGAEMALSLKNTQG